MEYNYLYHRKLVQHKYMNLTISRKGKEDYSLRITSLEKVVESIRKETSKQPVTNYRNNLQYPSFRDVNLYKEKIPIIYFSAELIKEEDGQSMRAYNGLILLTINRLSGRKEADKIRNKVANIPQTMLVFVGASQKSVKILVPFCRPDDSLPQTDEEVRIFHAHAYRWAVTFYQGQLQQSKRDIHLEQPDPKKGCRLSYDPQVYFNPGVSPIRMEQPLEMPMETTYEEEVQADPDPLRRMLPGFERSEIIDLLFQTSLSEALDSVKDWGRGEGLVPLLTALARNCFRSGIPEEEAVCQSSISYRLYEVKDQLISQTIHNVYTTEKRFGANPCIPAPLVMSVKTDEFMKRRYEFRHNRMKGSVEYRERKTFCYDFQPVTERVLNTIAVNAMSEGLNLWDRDVKRWVNSSRVPLYSPINEYLYTLPEWDGKDRIHHLATCVPCSNQHWPLFFRRWFLSMVAHWMGGQKQYANSVSPLLVGAQGCGKSIFCRNLLPTELRPYYTDSIDFSHRRDAEMYLTRFALINIDEFDQISVSHQGFLKHILQKPVVNLRKPHQTAVEEMRRYASFIATSNHSDLLTDPSGSRRFICINVADRIRDISKTNYGQLYAQAQHEIQRGERYYFSPEEEALMMEYNQEFEVKTPVEQLFQQYFRGAEEKEKGRWMMAVEILEEIQSRSGIKLSSTKIVHFGRILGKLGVVSKRLRHGTSYHVVEL